MPILLKLIAAKKIEAALVALTETNEQNPNAAALLEFYSIRTRALVELAMSDPPAEEEDPAAKFQVDPESLSDFSDAVQDTADCETPVALREDEIIRVFMLEERDRNSESWTAAARACVRDAIDKKHSIFAFGLAPGVPDDQELVHRLATEVFSEVVLHKLPPPATTMDAGEGPLENIFWFALDGRRRESASVARIIDYCLGLASKERPQVEAAAETEDAAPRADLTELMEKVYGERQPAGEPVTEPARPRAGHVVVFSEEDVSSFVLGTDVNEPWRNTVRQVAAMAAEDGEWVYFTCGWPLLHTENIEVLLSEVSRAVTAATGIRAEIEIVPVPLGPVFFVAGTEKNPVDFPTALETAKKVAKRLEDSDGAPPEGVDFSFFYLDDAADISPSRGDDLKP
jgi:hypothetical protein